VNSADAANKNDDDDEDEADTGPDPEEARERFEAIREQLAIALEVEAEHGRGTKETTKALNKLGSCLRQLNSMQNSLKA
jgi:RNA polymerase primary sigma factor